MENWGLITYRVLYFIDRKFLDDIKIEYDKKK
jgi:hypothetical protein